MLREARDYKESPFTDGLVPEICGVFHVQVNGYA